MISTSPIKISCVIAAGSVPEAVTRVARRLRARRRRDPARGPDGRAPPDGLMARRPATASASLGATGAVGSTMLEVLAERDFPASEVVAFTSERSAGREVAFGDGRLRVPSALDDSIDGLDLVLSSAGGAVSSEWAPRLVEAGAVVVDNTSFWRMHDDVPLVVAEVNPDALDVPQRDHRQPELLDDADGRRARADPARRGHRADRRLDLPVGLGHRPAGDRRARGTGPRDAPPGRARRGRGLSAPDRVQRPAPGRDLQATATTTRPRSAR